MGRVHPDSLHNRIRPERGYFKARCARAISMNLINIRRPIDGRGGGVGVVTAHANNSAARSQD
eukprot:10029520-Ditylum_brightwellii.AAC.1